MQLEDQILVNKYGQDLVHVQELVNYFNTFDTHRKRTFLTDLTFLIMQSKPNINDIEVAILNSKLKPTYTPCILLKKGVATHNLNKMISLPETELSKSFVLLLSLFKISYQRRFQEERKHPGKWWYADLSDPTVLRKIENELG